MKKKSTGVPKPKEFAVTPFALLKGVQAMAPAEPEKPAKVPAAKLRDDRDDMELFMLAMSDVARLGGGKTSHQEKQKAPVRQIVRRIDESEQQLFFEALETLKLDKVFRDEVPEAGAPASTSRRARQLRRGAIRIDYELDLHGLTKDEALEALASFIGGAYRRRQQAVLVITGRGNHSPDEPVLKKAVGEWLRNAGKKMVVETLPAPRQLGGEGAVVVFIRSEEIPGS
jgi:DNA-nicking Smr family endonuclease